MSYRDVRNFIEMTRALGYPSLISMESFRIPNYPLVAALLVWLSKRFDPDVDIPPDIGTEDERVALIRNAAQFMALKANIKLNTKRLYQADGYAVKELLKITTLLYDALNLDLEDKEQDQFDQVFSLKDFDLTDKISELKLSRQLASEITTTGASLFDLLGKEVDLRAARHRSMGRQYEVNDVETGLKRAIEAIKSEIDESKQMIDGVATAEANLDTKIERRRAEIDRYEKRLQTLKKVRPAFLEEFTALETELEQLFVQYSTRARILNQLERLVTENERAQLEKQMAIASPRIETIPLEANEEMIDANKSEGFKQERPRASTGGRTRTAAKTAKVYGGMQPPLSATPSLSSDSETDELFIDKDESELIQSDDESLALEMSEVGKRAQSSRRSNSDDDF